MSNRLNPNLLTVAYAQGYFPMPDPDTNEILWFRPDPRAIIPLDGFHVSRSLRRTINRRQYKATIDKDFDGVVDGCADRDETWITPEFKRVYTEMYRLGLAHSVEVWHEEKLVGGLYGVHLAGAFFAESKFHRMKDASKFALYNLVESMRTNGFKLLEVQFMTPHLASLGAIEVSAERYQQLLAESLKKPARLTSFGKTLP